LVKYNEAFAGCAERIVGMAERQAAHRQEIEKAVVTANIGNERRGQIISGALATLVLLGGLALVYMGKDLQGFTILVGETATLAGVWIYSKRQQRRELGEKRPQLPAPKPPVEEPARQNNSKNHKKNKGRR